MLCRLQPSPPQLTLDALEEIFAKLDDIELTRAAATCRAWRQAAHSPRLAALRLAQLGVAPQPERRHAPAALRQVHAALHRMRHGQGTCVVLGRGRREEILALQEAPDGRWLLSGSWSGQLTLWNAALRYAGRVKVRPSLPSYPLQLAFSPCSGSMAAVACTSARSIVAVWSLAEMPPRSVRQLDVSAAGQGGPQIALSDAGRFLACCVSEEVQIYAPATDSAPLRRVAASEVLWPVFAGEGILHLAGEFEDLTWSWRNELAVRTLTAQGATHPVGALQAVATHGGPGVPVKLRLLGDKKQRWEASLGTVTPNYGEAYVSAGRTKVFVYSLGGPAQVLDFSAPKGPSISKFLRGLLARPL